MLKIIKAFMLAFVGYLFQVCVMPYLTIASISPNLIIGIISVLVVAYGPFYAFGAGAVCGILMEIMVSSIDFLYLIIYPVLAFLGSIAFADKSERKLEQERSMGKSARNLNPVLRTVCCSAMNITIYEAVNLIYVYLTGVDWTFNHLSRALISIVYCVAITMVIMIPLRRFLGIKHRDH